MEKSINFAATNIENIFSQPQINITTMAYVITDKCTGCDTCRPECPVEAISGEAGELHHIDPDTCIDCGTCAGVCPEEAIIPGE